jgi:hypothetical protein
MATMDMDEPIAVSPFARDFFDDAARYKAEGNERLGRGDARGALSA